MNIAPYATAYYTLLYIGDGEGNIEDSEEGQWKTSRSGDDHWEMALGRRISTEE